MLPQYYHPQRQWSYFFSSYPSPPPPPSLYQLPASPARLALPLCFVYQHPASQNIPLSRREASQRALCSTKAQSLAKQRN